MGASVIRVARFDGAALVVLGLPHAAISPRWEANMIVLIRSGQLRASLFPGHWYTVGPRLKRGIEATCHAIDHDTKVCVVCHERILAHDNNTVFPTWVEVKAGGNIDIRGGACCPECSKLSELLKLLWWLEVV